MGKRTIIVTAVPLIVAGIVGASAFVAGNGTADASAKSQVAPLVVNAAIDKATIGFGDRATVTVTGTNPNHGSMKISGVTLNLVTTGLPATCPAASFVLGNPTPPLTTTLLASGVTNLTLATTQVAFVDLGTATDQSTCDAQDIKIHAVVS